MSHDLYKYRPDMKVTKETGDQEAMKRNVERTLKRAGEEGRIKEFRERVDGKKDYDKVMGVATDFVNIKDQKEK